MKNILYFVDISSIGFIFDELAKIQLGFKEPGISHFYSQDSRMKQYFLYGSVISD